MSMTYTDSRLTDPPRAVLWPLESRVIEPYSGKMPCQPSRCRQRRIRTQKFVIATLTTGGRGISFTSHRQAKWGGYPIQRIVPLFLPRWRFPPTAIRLPYISRRWRRHTPAERRWRVCTTANRCFGVGRCGSVRPDGNVPTPRFAVRPSWSSLGGNYGTRT